MRASVRAFHQALRHWYARHGRHDLPWRMTRDSYPIYVSEIMLQQTQVETVRTRFYVPFLERFPTLEALAAAPREDVLKAWQGLGYYSRAVNLHKAAQLAAPALPREVEALMRLPGIGRNTAHALAAFAYRAPVPVLEANVKRVLHRIFALPEASEKTLWQHAQSLLDTAHPFEYNQAMMDIGALICTPRAPQCGLCPARSICAGKEAPERYPAPRRTKAPPVRQRIIVIVQESKGRIYATPRTGRFLAGLYHFVELPPEASHFTLGRRKMPLAQSLNIGSFSRTYSHFILNAEVRLLQMSVAIMGEHWHTPQALAELPFSQAERQTLTLLEAATFSAAPQQLPRAPARRRAR